MRRALVICAVGLAGCAPTVDVVPANQYRAEYTVTVSCRSWHCPPVITRHKQAEAAAHETCAQLGRMVVSLGIEPGVYEVNSRSLRARFECLSPQEIVQIDKDSYEFWFPSGEMPFSDTCYWCVPPQNVRGPDTPAADKQATQRAGEYCAKMNKTMKITGGAFDMGPGLTLIFSCVGPAK